MVGSMRWNTRAVHLVRRLRWLALSVVLTVVVGSVFAAGRVSVSPTSTMVKPGIDYGGMSAYGLSQTTEWAAWYSAEGAAGRWASYTTKGGVSASTLGSLGRKALRGGVYGAAVGLAVEGIIDGAGWAINELKDQVMSGPAAPTEVPPQGEYWVGSDGNFYSGAQPAAIGSAASRTANNANNYAYRYLFLGECSGDICSFQMEFGPKGQAPIAQSTDYVARRWNTTTRPMPVFDLQPQPVSDTDFGNALGRNPQLVNDLMTDPRTGRPVMTPELQKQKDDLQRQLEEREGLPVSSPSPAPDLEDDSVKDDGSPWPSFCGWASAVCKFIDWFKQDGDQDMDVPERDVDIDTKGWSSGVGGGSCPAAKDFSVTVAGAQGSASFDWQPVCNFATTMKPVLITVCSVVAILIIAGLRSGGAKE